MIINGYVLKMNIPSRYINLDFMIDANRINALQKLDAMNQLELWHQNDVIQILMCDIAQDEARKGKGGHKRYPKAFQYIDCKTFDSHKQQPEYQAIRKILWPSKTKLTPNEKNDIAIVFHAMLNHCVLITNDGASKKQPGGILGNRDQLKQELGVTILWDFEAVNLVRGKIAERDKRTYRLSKKLKLNLPDWFEKD